MGGERSAAAPIEEIVFVLDNFAPGRLNELRNRFPESAETILSPRGVLAGSRKVEEIKARAEAALQGVEVIETLCEQGLRVIGRRLAAANRLDFIGEIISVVGSSSALFSIVQDLDRSLAGTGAAIALVGALASIGSKHLRRGVRGGKDDLFGPYTTLAQSAPQAADLGRELRFIMKMPAFSNLSEAREQIMALIARTNELSRAVYEAVVNVPGLEIFLKSGNL